MSLLVLDNVGLSIGGTAILHGVSLRVEPGEVLGLVGESGSGKSMTALSILKLLPRGAALGGTIGFEGADIVAMPEHSMVALRGDKIGMIFQEPMTALNPLMTIGDQVAETIRIHRRASRAEAMARARDMLERVGLPQSEIPASRYPHELSGGQRQRVGIAMAVALRPRLLIADEPTTALDITTQRQILELLAELVREQDMAMLLITHDLGVVAQMADTVAVMQQGRVVEQGATHTVLTAPRHPYTQGLLDATAPVSRRRGGPGERVLLSVHDLMREYPHAGALPFAAHRTTRAVDGVSLEIRAGESVGLVGESGSGKSSLARAIVGLDAPQAGHVRFAGQQVGTAGRASRAILRDMQMVFQDPYGSFDPRHTVNRLVAEPLHLLGAEKPRGAQRDRRVADMLAAVGIDPAMASRFIHEFSGGQRQRIAIARALIVEPALIVLDEAVSALDVSIRAQILDLLADISQKFGVAYLFIAHDLAAVRSITDRVLVMQNGRIVEEGPTEAVLTAPRNPYTQALVAAAPKLPDRRTPGTG